MSQPEDRLYTKTHEWIMIEGDKATVGITDFAQKELTDIVFVELPEVGRRVGQGEAVAVVESVKTASDVYSPLSGEISEVNSNLSDQPELINRDPYGKAWIFKIEIDGRVNRDDFLDAAAYKDITQGGDGN
ncbi:MAG: glycine cleavage system protein GcvH [Candidatus Aureabacteria bacterium]|nr:glycine cleavage system protein GcvH [Candidatus Auribacterota bacterium]